MPTLHNYKVFISHAWSYGGDYDRITEFLDQAGNFSYSNYSVPKDKAFDRMTNSQLKEQLQYQINPTQIAVILGGMYVAHSEWIQYEIDHALAINKPILGVRLWGSQRLPAAVTEAANEIVGWNTDSIVSAIRRLVP